MRPIMCPVAPGVCAVDINYDIVNPLSTQVRSWQLGGCRSVLSLLR